MTIRAVLFDLYDTLLYTRETGTREEAARLVAAAGLRPEAWVRGWRVALNESMRGRIPSLMGRVRRALAEAEGSGAETGLALELAALMWAREMPCLYPDVHKALAELRGRGFRLALVSNIEHHQKHWIRELELEPCFDAMVLSCEVGFLKPGEEIYRLAAERLWVSPGECIFVGDGLGDELQGAKAVGMMALRVDREIRHEREPRDETFDLRVRDLEELLAWLPLRAGRPEGGSSLT